MDWNDWEVLEARLTEVQDQLAAEAVQRNEQAFESLCIGKKGIGGVYGMGQWLQGAVRRARRRIVGEQPG